MNRYHVCKNWQYDRFEAEVNQYLEDGWTLYKGLQFEHFDGNKYWMQIVVKL